MHVGSASSRTRRPEREADLYRSRIRFLRCYRGDRIASLAKAQIVAFMALKRAGHGALRAISGGRYGRPVIPLRQLASMLERV
jgi:hypothetical protein